jgi:hypothetical protein
MSHVQRIHELCKMLATLDHQVEPNTVAKFLLSSIPRALTAIMARLYDLISLRYWYLCDYNTIHIVNHLNAQIEIFRQLYDILHVAATKEPCAKT